MRPDSLLTAPGICITPPTLRLSSRLLVSKNVSAHSIGEKSLQDRIDKWPGGELARRAE
jgi:hypothetical protein